MIVNNLISINFVSDNMLIRELDLIIGLVKLLFISTSWKTLVKKQNSNP